MKKLIVFSILSIFVCSCATFIPKFIGKKEARYVKTKLNTKADLFFWENLHNGNYDSIPQMLYYLQAAYIENPRDPSIAFHLGHTHLWKASERGRTDKMGPETVEHLMLAKKYFQEAYDLSGDPRALGFLASMGMAVGSIDRNSKMSVDAYFKGKQSIKAWPQFNLFTIGYSMSGLSYKNKRYQEAVEMQWKNIEKCAGKKIDRKNPDMSEFINEVTFVTEEKLRRTCWNSWIAPHNLEGFCLNFGDMLVKAGEVETAIIMYKNAKLVPEYNDWPYKHVLEDRIKNAERNVEWFRNPKLVPKELRTEKGVMMAASTMNCMGCHQKTKYVPAGENEEYLPQFMKDKYVSIKN